MTWRIPMPWWCQLIICIAAPPIKVAIYMIEGSYLVYKKHTQKKPVRPLPRDRKRALTLPLPESSSPWYRKDSTRHQKTFDQSQSSFFRLPLELREIIYRQVIVPSNGSDLHVGIMAHRLCGIPCNEMESSLSGWRHNCWEPTDRIGRSVKHFKPPHSRPRGFFGLLQSCRKMLATSLLLYMPLLPLSDSYLDIPSL